MHEHEVAKGVIEGHPAISGVDRFLKKHRVSKELIDFICQRLCFAYPRTLWLKYQADKTGDIQVRQSFDPVLLGAAINAWVKQEAQFSRIVFDLRQVTILDLDQLLAFFRAVTGDLLRGFYVCDEPLSWLLGKKGVDAKAIVPDETTMLQHLRSPDDLRQCSIPLPAELTAQSLDQALLEHASKSQLACCDVACFDMCQVVEMDFTALSMLAPVIHSLAHCHGVLATVTNPRRKISRSLEQFGVLQAVASYLVPSPPNVPPPEVLPYVFPVRTFTVDDSPEMQDHCMKKFDLMLETYKEWFTLIAGLTRHSTQQSVDKAGRLLLDFRRVIRELAENVAQHSDGLGYISMEFQQAEGLKIYMGDTGIGLARGIAHKYQLPVRGDMQALKLVLNLMEHKHRRRRLPGGFAYGGRGLEKVSSILGDLHGRLTVRSGTAEAVFVLHQGRDPAALKRGMYRVLGTHLHIFVPTHTPH
jgi:hypothetical protein